MNYIYLRFKKHNFIYYMINPKKSDLLILLGKRIRYLRLKKKMSQRDLGIEALMEKPTIQRIERGLMNCTINTLLRFCLLPIAHWVRCCRPLALHSAPFCYAWLHLIHLGGLVLR